MNAFNRPSAWLGAAVANEMQSMGLLPREAWIDDVKARAAELFAGNEHLCTIACLIAASHPRAIDYLEQAPIAARILADSNPCRSVKQRQYLCRVAGEFAAQGSSLNAWLKAKKVSPHLRRLRPYALTSSFDLRFYRLISTVNPSALSQAIPEKGGFQRFWLEAVKAWCGRYQWRGRVINNLEWAVKNLKPHKDQASEAGNLADYAMEIGADFDDRWTLDVVQRRSREWHDEVAAHGMANKTLARMGLTPSFEVDYAPFPDRHKIDHFTFVALKSAAASQGTTQLNSAGRPATRGNAVQCLRPIYRSKRRRTMTDNHIGWVLFVMLVSFIFGLCVADETNDRIRTKIAESGAFEQGGHVYRLVEVKP